jgi:hypothetical protein
LQPAAEWFLEQRAARIAADREFLREGCRGETRCREGAGENRRDQVKACLHDVFAIPKTAAALFAVATSVVLTTYVLAVLSVGVPLLIGAAFVGDPPTALLVATGFVVLALAGATGVVAAARVNAKVSRLLLSPRRDPLAEAKELLDGPGPLAVWPSLPTRTS